jgi:hypothetical protein
MKAIALSATLLALAGCTMPYEREHAWTPSQANKANLAAQAADWRDLARGHGLSEADGEEAARAVDRLRHDKVKHLTDIETSTVVQTGGGGGS